MLQKSPVRSCILLFGYVLVPMPSAALQEDYLPRIKERHQISRESIRTIAASYKVDTDVIAGKEKTPWSRVRTDWWQEGETIRCNVQMELFPLDGRENAKPDVVGDEFLLKNGRLTRVFTRNGKSDPTERRVGPKAELSRNLWADTLFVLDRKEETGLVQILEEPNQVRSVELVRERQASFYKVIVDVAVANYKKQIEVHVDPKHGYFVRRVAQLSIGDTDTSRSEANVLVFRQVAPAIYFPVHLERKVYLKDAGETDEKLFTFSEIRFDSIVVNQPIDPKIFELKRQSMR